MSKKFLTNIDLNKNELQNARIQNLGTAPSAPVKGQTYFDTVTNAAYIWNGTAWISTDAALVPAGSIPNTALVTNPLARANHTGTQSADTLTDGTNNHLFTTADETKLDGIAAGATANQTDAYLLARANHTGTQAASTISDLATVVKAYSIDEFADAAADVAMGGYKITNLADPVADTDAANKGYVDGVVAGISWKDEVRVATTAAGTLATSFANGSSVDGVTLDTGDRILIKNQAAGEENGIYVVQVSGAPVRASDANTGVELAGAACFVTNGTANGGKRFLSGTTGTIVVNTTPIDFVMFDAGAAYSAGAGLTLSGSEFNVGAGTGIIVNANDVAIDTAVVARKYSTDIGNGALTSIVVTHNLGTKDVHVSIRQNADDVYVEADVIATSINTVTLGFSVAPTASALRVTVLG